MSGWDCAARLQKEEETETQQTKTVLVLISPPPSQKKIVSLVTKKKMSRRNRQTAEKGEQYLREMERQNLLIQKGFLQMGEPLCVRVRPRRAKRSSRRRSSSVPAPAPAPAASAPPTPPPPPAPAPPPPPPPLQEAADPAITVVVPTEESKSPLRTLVTNLGTLLWPRTGGGAAFSEVEFITPTTNDSRVWIESPNWEQGNDEEMEFDSDIMWDQMDFLLSSARNASAALPHGHELASGIPIPVAEPDEKKLPDTDHSTKRCIICCEREVSTAFLECQHSLLCVTCSRTLVLGPGGRPTVRCPMCRAAVKRVMKLLPA